MSECTQGPWAVREGDGNYLWEVVGKSPRGKDVVICRPAGKDRIANAKLIAAAPELRDALNAVREAVKDHPDFQNRDKFLSLGMRVVAALTKAGVSL